MMDITGVKICRAHLSIMKESIEMLKFQDIKGINLEDTIQKEQLEVFQAEEGRYYCHSKQITMLPKK